MSLKWLKWLDGRLGKRSVASKVCNKQFINLVIVKYGDISLVLCISTRLRLVTILSLLVKYTLTRVISLIYICLWSKKKLESYFRDRLTFLNIDSRTSR